MRPLNWPHLEEHGLDADDLFAIMEVMEILEFAHIRKGKIKLTSEGVSFFKCKHSNAKENICYTASYSC